MAALLLSNHEPLQHLFGKGRRILAMALAQAQCWALTLSAYDYEVQYIPGKEHTNADVFNHLHSRETKRGTNASRIHYVC